MAFGNIVGSNIFNIALILGVAATDQAGGGALPTDPPRASYPAGQLARFSDDDE